MTNVAQYGNCFVFNAEYNIDDSIMYMKDLNGYNDTGKRRTSSLTGPSFGLNLVLTLGKINYMDGEITKEVLITFKYTLSQINTIFFCIGLS